MGIHKKEKTATSTNGWIHWGMLVSFLMTWIYYFFKDIFWDVSIETNILFFVMTILLGFIWPVRSLREAFRKHKLCGLPLEPLLLLGFVLFGAGIQLLDDAQYYISIDLLQRRMQHNWSLGSYEANFICLCIGTLITTLFMFLGWFLGVSFRAIYVLGLLNYFKEKCLLVRLCLWIKNKLQAGYRNLEKYALTGNAHKTILKIVIVNALILFVISSLWFGGFAISLIYSVILYFVLRKYVSTVQIRYGILLKGVNDIAEGNLNVTISEDLGLFEPMKPQIIRIQNGFKNAVENEIKSQRMKSELITNVSHDLKTPLTAIITYINLLKDEKVTEEQRREYLDTLERKSLRLKVLIEDLFEVSKATSNNVTLNYMDVDILNLVKQVAFEMSDKLSATNLDVRMNLPDGKINLRLDSQKTYRVYENLFGNVAKYAMPGTRVYVSGALKENCVEIILRNITAQEITVDSAELTERFVRNDTARNTEGSGLGLAIAKSFMELQGGELSIDVDGDLFKVTTRWQLDLLLAKQSANTDLSTESI